MKRPVRFIFEPGPNLSTERFAFALSRATEGRAAGSPVEIRCEVAQGGDGRSLSLQGVFREMERADALVCSDSFSAHAGPVFGCATLVLAQEGLESWRVPEASSFYFDVRDPIADIAAGMGQVLDTLGRHQSEPAPWVPARAERLSTATENLTRELRGRGSKSRPAEAYEEMFKAYRGVAANLSEWPESFVGLLADCEYERLLPPLPPQAEDNPMLARHIRDKLEQWRNSNLWKYLELARMRTAGSDGATVP